MKSPILALLLSLPLLGGQALALQLNPDASTLNFVSVKNDAIAEVLSFQQLSGNIEDDGTATISVPLGSVNTGIDIRNERMRKFLFNVQEFPSAVYVAKLDMAVLKALKVGESARMSLEGVLNLHGQNGPINFEVLVNKLGTNSYQATTVSPGIVDSKQFGLLEGVAKLQSLAGLKHISPMVPVTFSVVFQ